MNEPPSRLDLLRFLERVQLADLERTRRWIAEEEQRAAVTYVVEPPIRLDHPLGATVHREGCTTIRRDTRPMSSKDAQFALRKDPLFHPCEDCRPQDVLGVET
ncbi:hypothetical protein E2C11_23260 [Streptomyces lavendulae]|nr:DUF6233 domain-containing protein [Streptomyces lavendulae]TXJ75434.1 hypothetical protein E2C11_23260 [Streptomyces lavendulae]